jgi:O-succinylbenzoic acid--CoA ligase
MHKSIELCDGISTEYIQSVDFFLEEWYSQSDTITVFSSGSTGVPKEFFIDKSKVRASAKATGQFFGFEKGQTLLLNLSPKYIAGKLMIVRALEFEMNILVGPVAKNPLLDIEDKAIDFAAFVPYQVNAILDNPVTLERFQKIPHVIIGGAPISAKTEAILKTLGNRVYLTFGMTETITHFALKEIGAEDDRFKCLLGFTISEDERGCLVVNENLITERLVTNDLIANNNSDSFQWLGRIDNVVNSAGVKLFPELLERKVEAILPSNRFYFKGRKSDQFGEELVLYIEGQSNLNIDDVTLKVEKVLTAYERPKAIIIVSNFEETKSGKVKRIHFTSAGECT